MFKNWFCEASDTGRDVVVELEKGAYTGAVGAE